MTNQQSQVIDAASREIAVPESGMVERKLREIEAFQRICRTQLKQGTDYGVIPGTPKPTLLKPGAEKIVSLLGLDDDYEVLAQTEDWDKGFFAYRIKCTLTDLRTGSRRSGLGECNSMESRYRYRWVWRRDLEELNIDPSTTRTRKTRSGDLQYRVENDDPYSLVNTILKMSKKRALVDAALSAGRLSDLFTQDIEDTPPLSETRPGEAENVDQQTGEIKEKAGITRRSPSATSPNSESATDTTSAPKVPPAPSRRATPPSESKATVLQGESTVELKHRGQLTQRAWDLWKMPGSRVLKELNLDALEEMDISKLDEYWQILEAVMEPNEAS